MLPLCTSVTLLRPGLEREVDRRAHQPLRPLTRYRLDADARRLREADLRHAHLVLQEGDHLLGFGRLGGPLDAGVDVLGVLTENHHVNVAGPLHGARHVREPAHGSEAHVKVEHLPERDVEGTDALTDGCRQRTLDAHEVLSVGVHGFVGKPAVEELLRFFPSVHLVPLELALAAVRLRHRSIQDRARGAPDVGPRPVALDERQDRVVGHLELLALHADGFAGLGWFQGRHRPPLLASLAAGGECARRPKRAASRESGCCARAHAHR